MANNNHINVELPGQISARQAIALTRALKTVAEVTGFPVVFMQRTSECRPTDTRVNREGLIRDELRDLWVTDDEMEAELKHGDWFVQIAGTREDLAGLNNYEKYMGGGE